MNALPLSEAEKIQAHVAEVVNAARAKWGDAFHMRLAQEECAELIVAINHFHRERCSWEKLAEEIADVILIIGAARAIVGESLVDRFVVEKLARLERRVAEDSEHVEGAAAPGVTR